MAVLFFLATGLGSGTDTTLRVMTFNIRYDNPDDADNNWRFRKEEVAAIMRRADIVGVQEALLSQMQALGALLPEYASIGVGRDDGMAAGEFSAIFFLRRRYSVLNQGTFWLSEHPEEPGSRSWDAAITRIVTWGRFYDQVDSDTILVFNTHFDHRGREARRQSARLLLQKIEEIGGDGTAVVLGDFNTVPESEAYGVLISGRLADARTRSLKPPAGPTGTYTGFEGEPTRRIDYVFADSRIEVAEYAVIASMTASDHLAVVARLRPPGRVR